MRWSWLRSCASSFILGADASADGEGEGAITGRRLAATREPNTEPGRREKGATAFEGAPPPARERISAFWTACDESSDIARWRAIAALTARLPSFGAGEQELAFATRIDDGEGALEISPLGFLLCLLPSLDRTCLVSSWAASPDESTRRVLARALAAPFAAVGVDDAIELLQADPSEEIRRLADTAAARRHGATA